MRVLVACEFSGRVVGRFLALGHDAWSCDRVKTWGSRPDRHVIGDVRPLLRERWDLVIAFPPCTYLCKSGVRWLHERPGRWEKMIDGAAFFRDCLGANAPRVCVENPVPHRHALEAIGRPYSQIIQPWQFGHGETKATCLWLDGLPTLIPTKIVSEREQWIAAVSGKNRATYRSLTYWGVAEAMAEQWGNGNGHANGAQADEGS